MGIESAFIAAITLGLLISRLIRHSITAAQDTARRITCAAEKLNTFTDKSSRGLIRQNDEVQQAASAVTQMTGAAEEVIRHAASTAILSHAARADAVSGRSQARETVAAIDKVGVEVHSSTLIVAGLATHLREIGKRIEALHAITDQANRLALNVAIEAARAGEQGRRFAAVANDMWALAAHTKASSAEIENMIAHAQEGADQAVCALNYSKALVSETQWLTLATGQSLERVTDNLAQIKEHNRVIASTAQEQSSVAQTVERNLSSLQDLSTQTAAAAHQSNASNQELSRQVNSFNHQVLRFPLQALRQ